MVSVGRTKMFVSAMFAQIHANIHFGNINRPYKTLVPIGEAFGAKFGKHLYFGDLNLGTQLKSDSMESSRSIKCAYNVF